MLSKESQAVPTHNQASYKSWENTMPIPSPRA